MSIKWNNYLTCGELIKYLAFYPIRWDRYTRLNAYFDTYNNLVLQCFDYPDDPTIRYYGCLKLDNGETYIDFLQRINLIQPGSQLLSFPAELADSIKNKFTTDKFTTENFQWSGIKMPYSLEYPFIISGNIDKVKIEGCIKDYAGMYFPVLNIILIDQEKITNLSNHWTWENDTHVWPNFTAVYEIVLRHEIGHWLSHELLVNTEYFNDSTFVGLSSEIHEFWAQIIAHNLVDSDSEIQRFMSLLADDLPAEYQTYKKYADELSQTELRNLLMRRNEITNIDNLNAIIDEIKQTL